MRAKRKDPTQLGAGVSPENQAALDGYVYEGLIEGGWRPVGEDNKQVRKSIEAKAYSAWLRSEQGMRTVGMTPEETREAFLQRGGFTLHGKSPEEQGPSPGFEAKMRAFMEDPGSQRTGGGLTRIRAILPTGDAYLPPEVVPTIIHAGWDQGGDFLPGASIGPQPDRPDEDEPPPVEMPE